MLAGCRCRRRRLQNERKTYTHFTPEEIEYIYTNLGNGINHELCMKFVKSGYDLGVIDEGLQEKERQE